MTKMLFPLFLAVQAFLISQLLADENNAQHFRDVYRKEFAAYVNSSVSYIKLFKQFNTDVPTNLQAETLALLFESAKSDDQEKQIQINVITYFAIPSQPKMPWNRRLETLFDSGAQSRDIELRSKIADALISIPEPLHSKLAAQFKQDPSSIVREATIAALNN